MLTMLRHLTHRMTDNTQKGIAVSGPKRTRSNYIANDLSVLQQINSFDPSKDTLAKG